MEILEIKQQCTYSERMTTPRELSNCDIPEIYHYISAEKEMNLFFEGDIQQYGLESQTVRIYAFGDDWDCLLLKYYNNYIITSNKDWYDAERVASFLQQQDVQCLSAKETLLKQILPYYPTMQIQGTYLCSLKREMFRNLSIKNEQIVKLGPNHAQDIVELYKQIKEFAKPYIEHEAEKLEQTRKNFSKGCSGFGLFENGKLICTAYTTATTASGAMIVGVATHPSYRNRGYASLVMSHLCQQCFEHGLSFLCLFYDNPSAGAIYHRLGFETIGRWAMMKF